MTGPDDLGEVHPPSINAAEYIAASRLLEKWRVEENLAQVLKQRAATLQLAGALRHVQLEAYEEANKARIMADHLKAEILIRIGRD